MRLTSGLWDATVRTSHPIVTRVSSVLGTTVLAEDIPVVSGIVSGDDSGYSKRGLTLSVPARTPLKRWDPGNDAAAPLAAYGQTLIVQTGIRLANGGTELLGMGYYLITSWTRNETTGDIDVVAEDVTRKIADNRFARPTSPAKSATYSTNFKRLITECGLTPVVPSGFPDRVMGSTVWERDRVDALDKLVTAWGGRWHSTDDGTVTVAEPYGTPTAANADLVLTDGNDGVIVERGRNAERGRLYNAMVVNGKTPTNGGTGPYALATITDALSPIRDGGPYGRVTRFYSSDLITTASQATATAKQMLRRFSSVGRAEQISMLPNPAIEIGDVAIVYTQDGDQFIGRVSALSLPLTASDGAMTLTVTTVPPDLPEES